MKGKGSKGSGNARSYIPDAPQKKAGRPAGPSKKPARPSGSPKKGRKGY